MAETVTRLLDAAEQLMKARGWVAVSYRDLADAIGIRSASIHHHFPAKSDLGIAVTERYTRQFMGSLNEISLLPGALVQLRGYFSLVRGVLEGGTAMCLCARLIADRDLLPAEMIAQIQAFNDSHVAWLATLLDRGQQEGLFAPAMSSTLPTAEALWCELQGAQLLARSAGNLDAFDRMTDRTLQRTVAENGFIA